MPRVRKRAAALAAVLGIPGLLAAVFSGTLAGAGAVTVATSEATAYLSDDPRACVNCHVMREHYDGWQKASHHAAASCNDCHLPQRFLARYLVKAENGWWHSKGFTLQDFHEPIRIREYTRNVVLENCIRCHADLVRSIGAHSGPEAAPMDCIRCHDRVGHGPSR